MGSENYTKNTTFVLVIILCVLSYLGLGENLEKISISKSIPSYVLSGKLQTFHSLKHKLHVKTVFQHKDLGQEIVDKYPWLSQNLNK